MILSSEADFVRLAEHMQKNPRFCSDIGQYDCNKCPIEKQCTAVSSIPLFSRAYLEHKRELFAEWLRTRDKFGQLTLF